MTSPKLSVSKTICMPMWTAGSEERRGEVETFSPPTHANRNRREPIKTK
jgi:hypothetical protein